MNFLIIEADPIVVMDMIAILREKFPTAKVDNATTFADARSRLSEVSKVAAALVGMSVNGFDKTDLPDLIERKQGKIIFTHYGKSDVLELAAKRGWTPLPAPFTNETVERSLVMSGLLLR